MILRKWINIWLCVRNIKHFCFLLLRFTHLGKKPLCHLMTSGSHGKCLSGHMTSIHEGKKPFKCNNCDASSWRNKAFQVWHLWCWFYFKTRLERTQHQFMEEQSLSNALFVMLSLHEIPTWVDTWHQFMKERSLSNVTIVMQVLPQNNSWDAILNLFMKERSLSNKSFVKCFHHLQSTTTNSRIRSV